jgi:hypothetical protein
MRRSIIDFIASPKIDQSKTPINAMTPSFAAVVVSREWDITKRARLDQNITLGDGTMDPSRVMKSENQSSSFVPIKTSFLIWEIENGERLTDRLQ